MQKKLTVGELRAALVGVPDELEVWFSSDTEEAYEIVLEKARRVTYKSPDGRPFDDTGTDTADYFEIYGNASEEDEDYEPLDDGKWEELLKVSSDIIREADELLGIEEK